MSQKDGFEIRIQVIKTDAGYAYRVILIVGVESTETGATKVYRTWQNAYRAGVLAAERLVFS